MNDLTKANKYLMSGSWNAMKGSKNESNMNEYDANGEPISWGKMYTNFYPEQ